MFTITVSDIFKNACPGFRGIALMADIRNTGYNEELWKEIELFRSEFCASYKVEDINKRTNISATRQGYKATGKDPNRYRPSSEALCRRIVRGLPLYRVNTVVDLINLLSLKTGYSIGGFDADRIEGTKLVLGIGEKDEPYEGIGRGELNIEGMPVYRDALGGIGTPTSDHERTKLSLDTTRLLMIINGYAGEEGLKEAMEEGKRLLKTYADSVKIEIIHFEF